MESSARIFGAGELLRWIFTYCRAPLKETISIWKFCLFTDPFDRWTWAILMTTFFCVLPLSGKFMKVVMPLVSATLSMGITGPPTRSIVLIFIVTVDQHNSWKLLLW